MAETPDAPQKPESTGYEIKERRRASARERHRRTIARRRLGLLAMLGVGAFAVGALSGAGGESDEDPASAEPAEAAIELPRGGRSLLPEHRLVGFYGAPQDDALGALGIGSPASASEKLIEQARQYESRNRRVLPVFELLATIAAAAPGDDGLYRIRQPHSVIREYLAQARRSDGLLLLDIQPGRADFAAEVRRLERYLVEPDVGLALDPEWHIEEPDVPGSVIGSVDVETVNEISAELAATVRELGLPEKLFVIHQFTTDMIEGEEEPRDRPGLATILNTDGFGDQPNKISKYDELKPKPGSPLDAGFKLFYSEDLNLMTPEDVLALSPKPDLIVYE